MPPAIYIDPKVLQNIKLSDKELAQYTADLDDAYGESVQAGQTAIVDAAMKVGVSGVLNSKDIDEAINVASKVAGAAGGAAICSATGVGASLAPVCAAAGAWVGEKIGGALSGIASSLGDLLFGQTVQGATVGVYNPDLTALKKKRSAILSTLSQTGDDKEAIALIKELADKVAPSYPDYMKMPGWANMKYTPLGLGYATFLASPPFVIAPKAFRKVDNPTKEQLGGAQEGWREGTGGLDPYQGEGGFFFDWNGALGWEAYVVKSMVNPFVLAGIPVEWVKEQAMQDLPKQPGSDLTDYWLLTKRVSDMMIPEIDKWVQNRIRWILEEGAIRRNLRATKAISEIGRRLKEIHPTWGSKQIEEAKNTVASAVRSGDEQILSQVVSKLSAGDTKPGETKAKKDLPGEGNSGESDSKKASPEKEPVLDGIDPKYKKKGGGMAFVAVAVAFGLYIASRGLG